MSEDDFWVDKIKGDWWCVYHVSMEKPLACFPKKKQAVKLMQKEIEKHGQEKCKILCESQSAQRLADLGSQDE